MKKTCVIAALVICCIAAPTTAQESDGQMEPWFLLGRITEPIDSTFYIRVRNVGTAPLTGTVSTARQTWAWLDWLVVDPLTVSVLAGESDTLAVTIRRSLLPPNTPGTLLPDLEGGVLIMVDQPTVDDSIGTGIRINPNTEFIQAAYRSISTPCVNLLIGNNGDLGDWGNGGGNFNFVADCDQYDSIPGEAGVYLYDASPVVFTDDTAGAWTIFGGSLPDNIRFVPEVPLREPVLLESTDAYKSWWSGRFMNADTSLSLSQTVIAPQTQDHCSSMIVSVALWSSDGSAKNDLTLGYALDWDIPSDSNLQNSSGHSVGDGLVWQRGREVNEPLGDALECQDNDARFGGLSLLGYKHGGAGSVQTGLPYGAYVGKNMEDVIPTGGFVPEVLYADMQSHSGLSSLSPTVIEDLYSVMTFSNAYDLEPNDTLVMIYVITAVENGTEQDLIDEITAAKQWFLQASPRLFPYSACCELMGDVNLSGAVNLTDLTCLVNRLFVNFDIGCAQCSAAANTNGDAACSLTLTDLTKLVNYLFVSFEPMASCNDFDNTLCP